MTDDLIEFMRARQAEDEHVARVASHDPWRADGMQVRSEAGHLIVKHSWPQEIEHIVRWDPPRVLLEVAAKRQIVDAYAAIHNDRARLHDAGLHLQWSVLRTVVRNLALPYVHHPDYPRWGRP